MRTLSLSDHTHRRFNPLTGEWILVSPHRGKRPWQGQEEESPGDKRPKHDPYCYLCPGNIRAQGETNPAYDSTYVFTNDFSALLPDTPAGDINEELFKAKSEKGICRVICFSPRHDLTIPELSLKEIEQVVNTWIQEYRELGRNDFINHVQIFENKGSIMGCSNPHPHGQIWAQNTLPVEVDKEHRNQLHFFKENKVTLLADYLKQELEKNERIVVENEHFVALIPFWATWPFETMVISRRAISNISLLNTDEKTGLADIYKKLTTKYDNLFNVSFPYSMGIHQCPTDGKKHPEWHLHLHFYPPLLRSAAVKKFMVGYEMLANPQRDITAEQAGKRLRDLSLIHYSEHKKTNNSK